MWYVPHWCNDRAKSRENSCYNIRRCSCGGFSGYIVAICKEFEEETWWYELCAAIRSAVQGKHSLCYYLYILYALTNNFVFWFSHLLILHYYYYYLAQIIDSRKWILRRQNYSLWCIVFTRLVDGWGVENGSFVVNRVFAWCRNNTTGWFTVMIVVAR